MDEQLKQRLVGAAVLVLLGVVFIPQVLDGPGEPGDSPRSLELPQPDADGVRTHTIQLGQPSEPPPTEVEVTVAQRSDPVDDTSQAQEPDPDPQAGSAATTAPAPTVAAGPGPRETVAAADPITAWAVQVYSLSDAARAEQEASVLRDAGFPAFVTRVDSDGRTLFRVRVGPEQSREHAERLARRLSQELDLNASVVRHP